jgi:hypothetical protein
MYPGEFSLFSPLLHNPYPPPRHWVAILRRCLAVCSITKATRSSQLGKITLAASGDNL